MNLFLRHNGRLESFKVRSHRLGGRYIQRVLGRTWATPKTVWDSKGQRYIETSISLPTADLGFRAVSRLELMHPITVLFDDDTVFANRFRDRLQNHLQTPLRTVGNISDLSQLLKASTALNLFVDFRIHGHRLSGPELVAPFLGGRGYTLITSFPEDPAVAAAAKHWRVPVLAKSTIDFVPVAPNGESSFVLIDDDELTRVAWKVSAENAGISLFVLRDGKDLPSALLGVSRKATVFVDGSVLKATPGLGESLRCLGFDRIRITTGRSEEFDLPKGFEAEVLGKTPPWILSRCQLP